MPRQGDRLQAVPGGMATRIRAAALELFTARGYEGTSMRELADRVGCTAAALYYHFAGKDEIAQAVVTPFLDAADRLLDGAHGDAHELLAAYLDVLLAHGAVARLLERDPALRAHPGIGPRHAAQLRRLRRLLGGDDPAAQVRAAACLGALRAPLMDVELEPAPQVIVGAAVRALGGAGA